MKKLLVVLLSLSALLLGSCGEKLDSVRGISPRDTAAETEQYYGFTPELCYDIELENEYESSILFVRIDDDNTVTRSIVASSEPFEGEMWFQPVYSYDEEGNIESFHLYHSQAVHFFELPIDVCEAEVIDLLEGKDAAMVENGEIDSLFYIGFRDADSEDGKFDVLYSFHLVYSSMNYEQLINQLGLEY